MKKIALILCVALAISCVQVDNKYCEPTLAWLDKLIDDGGDGNGKFISVYSYKFNGNTVYLFNYELRCCDFFTAQLFDKNGYSLCFPYGGISGQGDKKCMDFDNNKSAEKLYWKKGK